MRGRSTTVAFALIIILSIRGKSQDQDPTSSLNFSNRIFKTVQKEVDHICNSLDRQTEKYLRKLEQVEKKMFSKLAKKDSIEARRVFGNIDEKYRALRESLTKKSSVTKFQNVYIGHIDSMKSMFGFLTANQILKDKQKQLASVFAGYDKLQDKLNQTESLKKYLLARQRILKDELGSIGLSKEFANYQKGIYYYKEKLNEYKRILNEPEKLEAKLLQAASHIPAFQKFFAKYSELGQLFRLPGADPIQNTTYLGLQSRDDIEKELMNKLGSSQLSNNSIQHAIQSGQSQVEKLKNKISNGNVIGDLPDFKPNNQKSKKFWQRFELGTTIQSTKSNIFFPATSDLALTIGYKLNDRSVIGVGSSYKLGWGKNIRNIRITHQGIGIRSFLDWKIKNSFYLSGGFEYNYQQAFDEVQQLYDLNDWQQSGLIGISKIVSLKNKWLKKTKIQALWDFLSYRQRPTTQPLKFRIGYSF